MLLPIMLCISVVPKDVIENFISLREHDFVGEDKRLRAMLVQRLAVLEGDVNLTDLQQPDSGERILRQLTASADLPDLEIEQDYLELNHTRKSPNNLRFNVSMDYAELFNFSMGVDEPWLAGSGGSSGNQNGALANFGGREENLTSAIASNSTRNLNASRRAPEYYTHSELDSNLHVLEIMKQNIYMVQERLLDIEPVIAKHENDVRFRIAYIFNRLDEWFKDMRTMYYAVIRERWHPWRVKKHLYYYEHLLRKNIDITYSVELVIYLHMNFMAKINEIMPAEQRQAMLSAKKQSLGTMNQSSIDFLKKNQSAGRRNEAKGRRHFARLPRL